MSSSCPESNPALIQPYLDGELADSDRLALENHLLECDACHAEMASARRCQELLRAKLAAPPAPASLHARIRSSLDREDAATRRRQRASQRAWVLPAISSVAAAAALALFAFRTLAPADTQPSVEPTHSPVVEEAVRRRFVNPTLVSGTRNDVSQSAAEFLRFPVRAPRFSDPDVDLAGWEPIELSGRRAARLRYQVAGTGRAYGVAVHMLDARNIDLRGQERRELDGTEVWLGDMLGFSTVTYTDPAGIGYVITSDMSREELVQLVENSDLLYRISDGHRR